jgi:hypothetical protein
MGSRDSCWGPASMIFRLSFRGVFIGRELRCAYIPQGLKPAVLVGSLRHG